MSVAPPSLLQETADVVAIGRLVAAYADAANERDPLAFARLWTDDAVLEMPELALRWEGADELAAGGRALVSERFELLFQLHVLGAVEIDGDVATGRVHGASVARAAGTGAPLRAAGLYDDAYRRTTDGWRIARRRYRFVFRDEQTPVASLER